MRSGAVMRRPQLQRRHIHHSPRDEGRIAPGVGTDPASPARHGQAAEGQALEDVGRRHGAAARVERQVERDPEHREQPGEPG